MNRTLTGNELKGLRIERGLTQADLAVKLGISQATISNWETDSKPPDEAQLANLYQILDLELAPNGLTSRITHASGESGIEGLDEAQSSGWGDYPLDSVFVRTDQRTVAEVVKRINANRYDLNPEFQRDFVWPVDKQSRLIESCIMRIPLPVLYVAEGTDGRIIVVDGLQRLTTFKRFLGNEFKLTFSMPDDAKNHPLQGLDFKHLDLKLQERVEDTQLTLYILDAKAPERAKLDIFDRVNSGEPLSRQQMRNCLYNGPATTWLRERSQSIVFLQATGHSLDSKRMRDREAINRFCAFFLRGWEAYRSGDMDLFLAEGLDTMNRMDESELTQLRNAFDFAMSLNYELFGRHAFRKSLAYDETANRSVLNIALFDVCSVVLPTVASTVAGSSRSVLRQPLLALLENQDFVHSITYSTNSRKQVEKRFRMLSSALSQVQR